MSRHVRIAVDGLLATVSHRDAAVVAPILSESVVRFSAGPGGVRGRRTESMLARPVGEGFAFAAKLVPYVTVTLRARGIRADIEYPRWQRVLVPDPDVVARLTGPAARLFARPGSRWGGLIRFAGEAHPHRVVPDLVGAYTRARVAVALANRDLVRSWLLRLAEALPGRPVVDAREYAGGGVRPCVLVCSLQVLDHCRAEDFDVVIVPYARPLLGLDARPPDLGDRHPPRDYRLLRTGNILAFGFIPASYHLHDTEERRMWALFHQSLRLGGVAASRVEVAVVSTSSSSGRCPLPDPAADLAGYRRVIADDDVRNGLIARIADRLARDVALLAGRGDDTPPVPGRWSSVLVLVAGPAHAEALARRLPGWAIRRAGDGADSPATQPDRVIATEIWAAQQPRLDYDALVDGRGENPLSMRGFPPHAPDGDRTVNLVDVGDSGTVAAARRTRRRLEQYRRRGWHLRPAGAEDDLIPRPR